MGQITPIGVTHAADAWSDSIQQALDRAIDAEADAEAEAKEEVGISDVFDHGLMSFNDTDKRIFRRALEDGDRRDLSMVISMLRDSYKAVVKQKKLAILSAK